GLGAERAAEALRRGGYRRARRPHGGATCRSRRRGAGAMLMVARRADSAGLTQVLVLRTLACATVALAPLEGYLLRVHGQLAKLAPALLALAWVVVRVRQRLAPRRHPVHVVLALFAVVLLASSAVHAGGPYTLDYTVRWLPFLALTVILIDLADREVPGRLLVA